MNFRLKVVAFETVQCGLLFINIYSYFVLAWKTNGYSSLFEEFNFISIRSMHFKGCPGELFGDAAYLKEY